MDDLLKRRREMVKKNNIVYSLYNTTFTSAGTNRINTGLRLFNATDFPNGFILQFVGRVTNIPTSYPVYPTWITCMRESSPYSGLVIRQEKDTSSSSAYLMLSMEADRNNKKTLTSSPTVGTIINITIVYDGVRNSSITLNGSTSSLTTKVTNHNFPLAIGGSMQTESSWFNNRNGDFYLQSLTVEKL